MLLIRAEYRLHERGWSLYGFDVCDGKYTHSAQPLTLQQVEHEEVMLEPFARIPEESLQRLLDDLWIGGMRPSKRLLEEQPADFMREQVRWDRGLIESLVEKLK